MLARSVLRSVLAVLAATSVVLLAVGCVEPAGPRVTTIEVRGVVTDTAGAPLAVTVVLRNARGFEDYKIVAQVLSNANGEYTIRQSITQCGTVDLVFLHPNFGSVYHGIFDDPPLDCVNTVQRVDIVMRPRS